MEAITFNNKTYAIDLNKLMEWINSPVDGNDNQLQTTVTEVWAKPDGVVNEDGDYINEELDLVSKELTDVKSDNSLVSAKFDIMKDVFGVVLGINYRPDGSIKTFNDFTLSEALCLNTLIENNIIYEINEDE